MIDVDAMLKVEDGELRDNRRAERTMPLAVKDSEAAKLLGISRGHLWKLNSSGRLPAPVRMGRSCRWRVAELEAWLAAGCPTRDRWEKINNT